VLLVFPVVIVRPLTVVFLARWPIVRVGA